MNPTEQEKGFARTSPVLQYDGPQMEDYRDFDSWQFARRVWAHERIAGTVNPQIKEAAERMKIRR